MGGLHWVTQLQHPGGRQSGGRPLHRSLLRTSGSKKCGLSNERALSLLEALKSNSTLCVLDIRWNRLMDNELVKIVIERVLINANGQSSQYSWIKPSALKDQSSGVSQQPRPRASRCIPLRTAKRTGRQR
ncbi:centrosomal protein of 78 kDa-like isoform 1-T3 [Salvelinus alpinus]|uniref:centrosomal protein of 78 kDa-like n=1 Tax=Salvelinus sp. IW2-2015 TaxID=2691554 RepID=UPI000CDF7A15|nr:centrosomal protein of 78 kDa-like [Salvelinus alpinus]XP_023834047.1 centrosomal protein of 78 kDa-like [Salvelinus alpinus]